MRCQPAFLLLALLPLACGEKSPKPSSDTIPSTSASAPGTSQSQKKPAASTPPGQGSLTAQGGQGAAGGADAPKPPGGDGDKPKGNRNGEKNQPEAVTQAQDTVQKAQDTVTGAIGDVTHGQQDPAQQQPATEPAATPDVELEYKPVQLDFAPDGPVKDANLDNFVVEMEVAIDGKSIGDMVFELWPEKAPVTVRNFLRYSQEGFYNGLSFHRVMKGFMVQGGDPKGDGTGQGKYGKIKGEFSTDPKYNHVYGVISMARSASPDSASCQFFICNATNGGTKNLDGKYASFGTLVWGKPVLDQLSNAPVTASASGEMSKPTQKLTILHSEVYRKKAWQAEEERRKAQHQQQGPAPAPAEQPKPQEKP